MRALSRRACPRPRCGSPPWYSGLEEGAGDVDALLRGADVIVRIEPGDIRVWDYADEFGADSPVFWTGR